MHTALILAALQDVRTRLILRSKHISVAASLDVDSAQLLLCLQLPSVRFPKKVICSNQWQTLVGYRKDISGVRGANFEYREAYLRSHLMDYMNNTAWGFCRFDILHSCTNPLLSSTVPDLCTFARSMVKDTESSSIYPHCRVTKTEHAAQSRPILAKHSVTSDLTGNQMESDLMVASVNPVLSLLMCF